MNGKKRIALSVAAGAALVASSCAPRPAVVEDTPESAAVVATLQQSPGTQVKVEKPADRGAALATEVLTPSEQGRARPEVTASPKRKPARDLQEPAILPPSTQPPPHPPLEKPGKAVRPVLLDEPAPLFDQLTSPRLPEPPHLAVGPRLRSASADVNQPIPLPLLGQPAQDRAPLDDPTLNASIAMALALSPPLRINPAPLLRLVLPNPFEYRESGRLRQPPEEDSTPTTATPRVPVK